MWPNPQFPADLVTFTEEILNEKLHFLCSVRGDRFTTICIIYQLLLYELELYTASDY